jgi:hypothetical protein
MANPPVVSGIVSERSDVVFDLFGPHAVQVGMLDHLDVPSVELHPDSVLWNPKYARLNQDDEITLAKLRESRFDRFGRYVVER